MAALHADPVGRAGGNQIAWLQGELRRDMGDQLLRSENHFATVRVLAGFAVDLERQMQVVTIADEGARHQPRAQRGEAFVAFAAEPVRARNRNLLARFAEIAHGDVVGHQVAGHVVQGALGRDVASARAHDHGQLDLPIDLLASGRFDDVVVGAGDAIGSLLEHQGTGTAGQLRAAGAAGARVINRGIDHGRRSQRGMEMEPLGGADRLRQRSSSSPWESRKLTNSCSRSKFASQSASSSSIPATCRRRRARPAALKWTSAGLSAITLWPRPKATKGGLPALETVANLNCSLIASTLPLA